MTRRQSYADRLLCVQRVFQHDICETGVFQAYKAQSWPGGLYGHDPLAVTSMVLAPLQDLKHRSQSLIKLTKIYARCLTPAPWSLQVSQAKAWVRVFQRRTRQNCECTHGMHVDSPARARYVPIKKKVCICYCGHTAAWQVAVKLVIHSAALIAMIAASGGASAPIGFGQWQLLGWFSTVQQLPANLASHHWSKSETSAAVLSDGRRVSIKSYALLCMVPSKASCL